MEHGKISKDILLTSLRPNPVVTSENKKILGMIEPIFPYEDLVEISRELKKSKYQEIVNTVESKAGR